MTRHEFKSIKIGDTVMITQHGKNRGKLGTVKNIHGYTLYLSPLDCEFEFTDKNYWGSWRFRNGLCGFNYVSLNYPEKERTISKINAKNKEEAIEAINLILDILQNIEYNGKVYIEVNYPGVTGKMYKK